MKKEIEQLKVEHDSLLTEIQERDEFVPDSQDKEPKKKIYKSKTEQKCINQNRKSPSIFERKKK